MPYENIATLIDEGHLLTFPNGATVGESKGVLLSDFGLPVHNCTTPLIIRDALPAKPYTYGDWDIRDTMQPCLVFRQEDDTYLVMVYEQQERSRRNEDLDDIDVVWAYFTFRSNGTLDQQFDRYPGGHVFCNDSNGQHIWRHKHPRVANPCGGRCAEPIEDASVLSVEELTRILTHDPVWRERCIK